MRLEKRDHIALVLWAADCAEHVLPYFEEKVPDGQPTSKGCRCDSQGT